MLRCLVNASAWLRCCIIPTLCQATCWWGLSRLQSRYFQHLRRQFFFKLSVCSFSWSHLWSACVWWRIRSRQVSTCWHRCCNFRQREKIGQSWNGLRNEDDNGRSARSYLLKHCLKWRGIIATELAHSHILGKAWYNAYIPNHPYSPVQKLLRTGKWSILGPCVFSNEERIPQRADGNSNSRSFDTY